VSSQKRHELRRRRDAVELALFTGAPAAAAEVHAALGGLATELGGDEPERLAALGRLARGDGDREAYRARWGVAGVLRFDAASGARIYQLRVETFPNHVNNVYLMREGGRSTLYDCGSQTHLAKADLERASQVLTRVWGEPAGLDAVDDLVLSHAHIDHFGGVGRFRGKARIHVHEFDARVVTRFEERILTAAVQLRVFLERAGVAPEVRAELEQMYVFTKQLFVSVPVDHLLRDGDTVNGYRAHHVPGHCPGQICLQVGDVLLTADHVLPRITPHQSPESITPWTGLDHYLIALDKIGRVPGIRLALPGHEEAIRDVPGRIAEIAAFHHERLERVYQLCDAPRSIAEISAALFGEQRGYGRLLAFEEAAAHVEYLARRGRLEVANLDDLLAAPNPVLTYRAA
jgi:glyoxylase-like metal-dependent hydrolase (beta-lactamase superfamily II)